jgi:CRISPR-associated protein Csd1
MSWIQKLYDTANEIDKLDLDQVRGPWPISHIAKKAHIEVTISSKGKLRNIKTLNWGEAVTLIPATEESANRAGAIIAPHPLCDELGYCAKDLPNRETERYEKMKELIEKWSSFSEHPKVKAVYTYLENGRLYNDLKDHGCIPFKAIGPNGKATPVSDRKIFIRWRVDEENTLCTGTWEDEALIQSWISFEKNTHEENGFCMLLGEKARIAKSHSRFIRASDDGAKLISSNDNDGYTFRGRFTDKKGDYAKQGCSIGYFASQKAHNALRWLIARQGYQKIGGELGECFIAWAVSGKDIPDLYANTLDFLGLQEEISQSDIGDVGEAFANRLKKKIAGYNTNIKDTENIVVMGLDSATPGRMAITFYRELTGYEFFQRIENWHSDYAWFQNYGKDSHFIGAPAPKDIAWGTYCTKVGKKIADLDKKLLSATIERILPCIVDGARLPNDLVLTCVRRVSNRIGLDHWEWEKCLGITCALYKGINKNRRYEMALEEQRNTRDYLYGRLLAVGEQIESIALFFADEKGRNTAAERLMQRFADRPFSTWKIIENSLVPYQARIKSIRPGLLAGYKELLDEIHGLFLSDEYSLDKQLTGEYLLGYHCQRKWLRERKRKDGKWVIKEIVDSEIPESEEN